MSLLSSRRRSVFAVICAALLMLGIVTVFCLASEPDPVAAQQAEVTTTVSTAVATPNGEATPPVEDRWAAGLRSSVSEAAAELDFAVFTLGDAYQGYPLTEIMVMNDSLYLYYRFDPQSPEAEAAGWEGFLVRQFSTARNAAHLDELRNEYPVIGTGSQPEADYEIRRGAGENRSLAVLERSGTTVMIGMFVNPKQSALVEAAGALKEVAK